MRRRILLNALSLTTGGGRSYVRNVLRELDQDSRGFDFSVLAVAGQLSTAETGGLHRIDVDLPSPGTATGVATRVLYEQLLLPLRARRFDLLYCLGDLSPVLGTTPTVSALRNPNVYVDTYYDNSRLRSIYALVRLAQRRVDRVVFPSQAAADLIAPRVKLTPEKVRVVPHGISPAGFENGAAPRKAEFPYLFLPAALERHKNFETLIRALPRVKSKELELWIAGAELTDPPYGAAMRELARTEGVGDRVKFLGEVPYESVLRFYRGAVALVFPSWLETFGHPLLEAMMAGTPILSSDIPSSREVAGDAASYFDPADPAELAARIDALTDEPAAVEERIALGRERVLEFTWQRSVDGLCAVFREVLDGEGRRGRKASIQAATG